MGRRLLREAEATARAWGYREMLLEVAVENAAARGFYSRNGYRVVSTGEETSGVGATVVRVREALAGVPYWEVETVDKCLMRKGLS